MPDLLQTGLVPALLFFDRLVVPDRDYVESAFHDMDAPDLFGADDDPEGDRTTAEVRLWLGYHLWPGARPAEDWQAEPRRLLNDLEYLQDQGLVDHVSLDSVDASPRLGSFGALDDLHRLDQDRIRIAVQMKRNERVDVCLVRHRPDRTALTSVPEGVERESAFQFLLKQMPLPADSVPLQDLVAFRNDENVAADLREFRVWMTRAGRQVTTEVWRLHPDTRAIVAPCSEPVNGWTPDVSSNRKTPKEKMSARKSTSSPRICSGAMYRGVPRTAPGSVSRVVDAPGPSCGPLKRARPKSRILDPAVLGANHVLRFQVSMHDVVLMGGREGAGDLDRRVQDGSRGQRSVGQLLPQGFAADILGDDIEVAVELLERIHGGNSRVRQRRGRSGLPAEAPPALFVTRKLLGQRLDGHQSPQPGILGEIHDAHPARTELSDDGVLTDLPANE